MKKYMLFVILLLAEACIWNPQVFHPGLGNSGYRVSRQGQVELGLQGYLFIPAFGRLTWAPVNRLNFSIGGGLTGTDSGGFQLAVNWLALNNKKTYLVFSPNVVTHKYQDKYSGVTLSLGITAGLKVSRVFNLYLNVLAGRYQGTHLYNGDAGEGDLFNIGFGFGFDFGTVRLNAEMNLPIHSRFGDTDYLPFIGLSIYFDL